ncbi:Gfo/Idh/MocA family oxidoreductase [Acidothermaceae bacterium B102]|nr:Gfo/Idh/MocA family oxidoreductase [Acidothermaceae bacterium B102]
MTEPTPTTDPVRWGFIGAGNIATRALGPAVRASYNAVLTAVGARDVQRAQTLGETFGPAVGTPVSAYGSYDALIADPDIEAVYISLPNDGHRPWTEAALAAGKHVLCEKPLGLDPAEVRSMTAAAEASGLHLVEASWYRWHPRVRLAQRLLAEGAIGTVRHVTSVFTGDGVAAGNYRLNPDKGGGAVYDIGHYALSGATWAFGGLPYEVVAKQDIGPTGVDLTTDAVLSYDGGDAEIHVSIAETGRQLLVITGDDGEIELRDLSFTAHTSDDTELWVSRGGTGTERMPVAAVDAYRLMLEEFSEVIRGRDGWLLPLSESLWGAQLIDAAFTSARAGGTAVDPR